MGRSAETPRSKYLSAKGSRPAGGAAFVDLFAGPGVARIRTSGKIISGSPLIAVTHARAPFSHVVLCDKDPENADALRKRTANRQGVHVLEGDCNQLIDEVIRLIPPHGLHIALLDPYGLRPSSFNTISRLGRMKRMDLFIHFPTSDINRNLQNKQYIDPFWAPLVGVRASRPLEMWSSSSTFSRMSLDIRRVRICPQCSSASG